MPKGKAGGFIRLPSGLQVPADSVPSPKQLRAEPVFPRLGKKEPKGVLGIRTRKLMKFGSNKVEIVGSTATTKTASHKLDETARKERREDNKAMKHSRQIHRRRRKHGR